MIGGQVLNQISRAEHFPAFPIEYNELMKFLNEYKNVTLEKTGVDDKVKFPNLLLAENEDRRIYISNTTAKAILPSLGYVMSAETKAATIEMPVPQLLPRLLSIMDKIVG